MKNIWVCPVRLILTELFFCSLFSAHLSYAQPLNSRDLLRQKSTKSSRDGSFKELKTALTVAPPPGTASQLDSPQVIPSFDDQIVPVQNNLKAADGGTHVWQQLLGEAEKLHAYLKSKEPQEHDIDRVIKGVEAFRAHVRKQVVDVGDNKEAKTELGIIEQVLVGILDQNLYHVKEVAPQGSMWTAILTTRVRIEAEVLPKLRKRADTFASDGGYKAQGEAFDEKLAQGPLYLKNPVDLEAVEKRGVAAIVLAAGEGTRMKPHLKQTFPFLGRPMSIWPIRALHEEGIPTVIVVGHEKEQVIGALEKDLPGLTYIEQRPPLYGTSDAVLHGLEALKGYSGPVLIINGDAAAMDRDFVRKMEKALRDTQEDVVVVGYKTQNPKKLGRVVLSEKREIIAIIEQSEIDKGDRVIRGETYRRGRLDAIQLVNTGFYGFKNAEVLRWKLRNLLPFRTTPHLEYGISGSIEAGLSGEIVTFPKEEEYKLRQPKSVEETEALIAEVKRHRRMASDGGQKGFVEGLSDHWHTFRKESREFRRRWTLAKTLRRQNVGIFSGVPILPNLLLGTIYIGPEVDISEFKNGLIERGTGITGRSKIGHGSHVSGHISNSIIGDHVVIMRGKEIVDSTIGNGSRLRGALVTRYDIEEDVRIVDSTLGMEGESTFGNGAQIAIVPEVGGRKIPIYASMTLDDVWRAVTQRGDTTFLQQYQETARRSMEAARSERGVVEEGVEIIDSIITDAHIGAYAKIGSGVEIENATILSNKDEQTKVVGEGTIIRNAIVQWGMNIYDGAKVHDSALLEHTDVGIGAAIKDSVIAPNSVIERGEVTSYLAGPFTVSHHKASILIAGANEGRGNIGGGHVDSNQPARQADQQGYYSEGIYWGINTSASFPIYLAPFGMISMHLGLPHQRVEYPFFWIRSPRERPNGVPEGIHEIVPAGTLIHNPYLIVRMEEKHKARNKARRTPLDLRIFKEEIIRQMIHVRNVLDNRYPDKRPKRTKKVYIMEDYPGLGDNFMTEKSRQRSIETYTNYIRLSLARGLKEKLENLLKDKGDYSWKDVSAILILEEAPPWSITRELIEEEWGRSLSAWGEAEILEVLEKAIELQENHTSMTRRAKEKDSIWEERVFGTAFVDVDDDVIIQELEKQTKRFVEETRALQKQIRELPHAYDGGKKKVGDDAPAIFLEENQGVLFETLSQRLGRPIGRIEDAPVEYLELLVTVWEAGVEEAVNGAYQALTFGSGMEGISALLFSALKAERPGEEREIIVLTPSYGGTHDLVNQVKRLPGVTVKFVSVAFQEGELHDKQRYARRLYRELEAAVSDKTRLVYFESPTNPTLVLVDIAKLVDWAKKKSGQFGRKIYTAIDNTFATSAGQTPLALGVDFSLQTFTKGETGSGDVLGSALIAQNELLKEARLRRDTLGETINPLDALIAAKWGIPLLWKRLSRQSENARKLSEWLEEESKRKGTLVKSGSVRYPGLPSHPQFELANHQMANPGHMLYFEFENHDLAVHFVNLLRYFRLIENAVSLGQIRTLAEIPAEGTSSEMDEKAQELAGLSRSGIRMSIGIEDSGDLLRELEAILRILDLYRAIPYGTLDAIFMAESADGKHLIRAIPELQQKRTLEEILEKELSWRDSFMRDPEGLESEFQSIASETEAIETVYRATHYPAYHPLSLVIHHSWLWGILSGDHASVTMSPGGATISRKETAEDLSQSFTLDPKELGGIPSSISRLYARWGTVNSVTLEILMAGLEGSLEKALRMEIGGVSFPSATRAMRTLILSAVTPEEGVASKKEIDPDAKVTIVTPEGSPLYKLGKQLQEDYGIKIKHIDNVDPKEIVSSLSKSSRLLILDDPKRLRNLEGLVQEAKGKVPGLLIATNSPIFDTYRSGYLKRGIDYVNQYILDWDGEEVGSVIVMPLAHLAEIYATRSRITNAIRDDRSHRAVLYLLPYLEIAEPKKEAISAGDGSQKRKMPSVEQDARLDPEQIRLQATAALEEFLGENDIPYPPVKGLDPLREAIHHYELNLYGRHYAPDQIRITAGTNVPLENLLMVLLEPADDQRRVWVAGDVSQLLISLRSRNAHLPKVIILKLPRDGRLKQKKNLRELFDLAKAKRVMLIFDETDAPVLADPGHQSVVEELIQEDNAYAKHVVILVDLSRRTRGLDGWKIGYLLTRNEEILRAFSSMTSQTNTGVNLATQRSLIPVIEALAQGGPARELLPIPSIAGDFSLLSERGKSLKPSPTVLAADRAPKNALRFDIGQSGFGPSKEMIQGMLEAAQSGMPIKELENLVFEAHSRYLAWRHSNLPEEVRKNIDLPTEPYNTVIGFGVKPLVFNSLRAIVKRAGLGGKKGVVVAIPEPFWATYPEHVRLAGGEIVYPPTYEKNNFNVTVPALKRSLKGYEGYQKVLILNSPGNPAGQMYTEEELIAIAKWAVKNDVLILSDEIYGLLAFGSIPHISIASLEKIVPGIRERTIVFTGLAKEMAAPGLRVGFATAWDLELLEEIFHFTVEGPDRIALGAAWGAYRDLEAYGLHVEAHKWWLMERKGMLEKTLKEIGIPHLVSHAGIYLYADLRGFIGKQWKGLEITAENIFEIPGGPFFQGTGMEEVEGTGIVGVPGDAFGVHERWRNYLRLSFSVREMETLQRADEALRSFAEETTRVAKDGGGKILLSPFQIKRIEDIHDLPKQRRNALIERFGYDPTHLYKEHILVDLSGEEPDAMSELEESVRFEGRLTALEGEREPLAIREATHQRLVSVLEELRTLKRENFPLWNAFQISLLLHTKVDRRNMLPKALWKDVTEGSVPKKPYPYRAEALKDLAQLIGERLDFLKYQISQTEYLKRRLTEFKVPLERSKDVNRVLIRVENFPLKASSGITNPAVLLRDRLFVESGILGKADPSAQTLPEPPPPIGGVLHRLVEKFPPVPTPILELTIPQLVYTREQLDYAAASIARLFWEGKKNGPEIKIPKIPPHKIAIVQHRSLFTTPEERGRLLEEVGYNVFDINSQDVAVDFLTDSGTSAQSRRQWGGILRGDESYAVNPSTEAVHKTIERLWGFDHWHVMGANQGRAAENAVMAKLVEPGSIVIGNPLFDTTKANVFNRGGVIVEVVPETSYDSAYLAPFKGDLDLALLEETIQNARSQGKKIAFLLITATNNNLGGQPVSLKNMKAVRKIANTYGLLLLLDAARVNENAYFIKQREPGYQDKSIGEIVRETMDQFNGVMMSAKKDGLANMGAIIAFRTYELYKKVFDEVTRSVGLGKSYAGMSGRDLGALARGLVEGQNEEYLKDRIELVEYLGKGLEAVGMPVVKPFGGHGIYIDADRLLPHIAPEELPGVSLVDAFFRFGGIRTVEVGPFLRGTTPEGKEEGGPSFTRLAVPRRAYTREHMDYVIDVARQIYEKRESLRGFEFLSEDDRRTSLRHFVVPLRKKDSAPEIKPGPDRLSTKLWDSQDAQDGDTKGIHPYRQSSPLLDLQLPTEIPSLQEPFYARDLLESGV